MLMRQLESPTILINKTEKQFKKEFELSIDLENEIKN